ncbi:MAG TPA: LysR family transcriptional regulator [Gemmobacter sp.]|nr:LysR family transcriptional regulator [Gemmobacter sp.]
MQTLRRALPSMNGLFTFEAAACCGSFSRAAEELNVTPAAVSRMIARLEDHLETTLFLRQPGGTQLTENGTLLFDALARGFAGIEAALREIRDRRDGTETVSLSVSTGFTTHWLMPRMADFKKAFPKVDLRFQLVTGALSGPVNDVDLGMRFLTAPDDRLDATFIMPEILLPICSPAYLREELAEKGSLQPLPRTMINLSDTAQLNPANPFSAFFQARDRDSSNSLIFSDYAVVVQAALLGQGVALGWLNVVSHWMRMKSLVPASDHVLKTERQCHLVRLRDRPLRPIISQIRDWLIAELDSDLRAVGALYPHLHLK